MRVLIMFFKTLYVGIWEILEINQHYVSEKKERSKVLTQLLSNGIYLINEKIIIIFTG